MTTQNAVRPGPDPLELLRAADPVPHPVAYPAADVARYVAGILDAGSARSGLASSAQAAGRRRRAIVPVFAAACMVALAVGLGLLIGHHRQSSTGPSSGEAMSCTITSVGGVAALRARLERARAIVEARAKAAGGSVSGVHLDTDDGRLGFTPHGLDAAGRSGLCTAGVASIRPLVLAPVPQAVSGERSADPLEPLGFAVPGTEAQYAGLTAQQQSELRAAMSHYDCAARPGPASAGTLMCTGPGGGNTSTLRTVYLVGPALVGNSVLADARAESPGASGDTQWTVTLELTDGGRSALGAYTGQHNAGGGAGTATVQACAPTAQPGCADYLAMTLDGRVLEVPLTMDPITGGSLAISANLTERSATALADDYAAAALGLAG